MIRRVAPSLAVLTVLTGTASAQRPSAPLTIQGAVMDSARQPVPGAMVYLNSQRIFAFTDDAGVFALHDIAPGEDVLQIRKRGFAPRGFRLSNPDSAWGQRDLGSVTLIAGPDPSLTLRGTVVDSADGKPIADVEVMVNGSAVARTDAGGSFRAESLAVDWGMTTVLLRRVGYGPLAQWPWIDEQHTELTILAVVTPGAVRLTPVVVEGERLRLEFGRLAEFARRRDAGIGTFFTREDIEKRRPVLVSDMMRTVPGAWVDRRGLATTVRFGRRRGCTPRIWVDGMPIFDSDMDAWVWPDVVEAIEVYKGPAETPAQYSPGGSSCGAILIWTR